MEFRFETDYDRKSLTVLCRALRLSIRKKRSRRSRISSWSCVVLCILQTVFTLKTHEPWSIGNTIIVAAVLILPVILCHEDQFNAWVSHRNVIPGTEHAVSVFGPEGYEITTAAAVSEVRYDTIQCICETPDYFVLVLGKRQGQLFDKRSLTGGTAEEFRAFITEKTGLPIQTLR